MNRVLLIEDFDCFYNLICKKNKFSPEKDIIIALNPYSGYKLKKMGFEFSNVSEYYDYQELNKQGVENFNRLKEYLQNLTDELRPYFIEIFKDENFFNYFYLEFKVIVDSIMEKYFALEKILKKFNIYEIIYFKQNFCEPTDKITFLDVIHLFKIKVECLSFPQNNILRKEKFLKKIYKKIYYCYYNLKLNIKLYFGLKKKSLLFINEYYCLASLINLLKRTKKINMFIFPVNKIVFLNIPNRETKAILKRIKREIIKQKFFIKDADISKLINEVFYKKISDNYAMIKKIFRIWNKLIKTNKIKAIISSHGLCIIPQISAIAYWAKKLRIPFIVYQHGGLGYLYNPQLLYEVSAVNSHLFTYGDGVSEFVKKNRINECQVISIGNNRLQKQI